MTPILITFTIILIFLIYRIYKNYEHTNTRDILVPIR